MGRKLFLLITLVAAVFFAGSAASAGTITRSLRIEPAEVKMTELGEDGFAAGISGYGKTNYLDYPALPFRVIKILLPQGEEVVSYRLEADESQELGSPVLLAPFKGEYRDDGAMVGVAVGPEDMVGEDSFFPKWRVRHLGSGFYRGYTIAAFAVYPLRYKMDTHSLVLESETRLVVETSPASFSAGNARRERYVAGFREESRRVVESIVDNPEVSSEYSFNEIAVERSDRAFLPSYLPSIEGSDVSYLIITNEEMEPVFQTLADYKTKKGIPAVVRTVEWIEQNYRRGADGAETIRTFIQDAYAKWGVEWVLLGADTDIIPARYAYVSFYTGEFIPTDMYFSCLDGNWNADGDSLWGEAFHSSYEPGDDADMYAEVYLGRMPASSYEQAQILVNKVISYSTPVDTLSKQKFLFLAEVIWPTDYSPGMDIIMDGAEIAQDVYEAHLLGNPDVTTTRLYETYDLYPGSLELTKSSALDSMGSGTNHVVHVGHGFKYNLSVGPGSIVNYDADHIMNGDALFCMYLMNCTNVAFDTDCLAEHFLLNEGGGAFAATGSSRSAFPSTARPYFDRYYELLFNNDVVQLGKLHVKSREFYTPGAFGETTDRWTHFIYNYLGDPELNVYQGAARTFSITKPGSAIFGPNDISIQVYSGGSPCDSAYVCLYKEGDDYAHGATGPDGVVQFDDFLCKSGGYIYVTVTGVNHCPLADTILVVQETGPYLRVSAKLIKDYVVGNSDDVLDAGETVKLEIELNNTGQTTGEKLYGLIRSDDTNVTVIDSTAVYPDIGVGGKAYNLDSYRFSVDVDAADWRPVEFDIETHDSMGGFWSESFALEVHAPKLEVYIVTTSDTLPYGNNNGVIEEGEDFLLKVGVKNYGTGTACGLQGKIRSSDGDIVITADSVSDYSDINLLGTEYGDGFVLSETNIAEPNLYTFELTDVFGRTLSLVQELRNPGTPLGVILDASKGSTEMHLTWHPPDTLEQYRYQVYRSLTAGGPYEITNRDLIQHTLYRDTGLEPNTRYYYMVSAVDSCGNEGPRCAEVSSTTTAPQLQGWPNSMAMASASSPKIGDINGDSHQDVVVGSDYIYAWHANGLEIRDGDGKPLTWGVLNTEGDSYITATALAEIDGGPGLEIVASSYMTKEIFIFDHEGSVLPGWPQNTKYVCRASPVVGDVDDDGDFEVVAYDVLGMIYVWHHNGAELLDGDDDPATIGPFKDTGSTGAWRLSTPALADMDEDGIAEIIVCSSEDSIFCLNADGSSVTGWPVAILNAVAKFSASPAIGDIDGDGHLELVIQSSAGRVYGLNHDGSWMSGWESKWIYSNKDFPGSPALGDMTGDGKLEVVIPGMDGNCYVFRYDGTSLPNWPQPYASSGYTECSPIVVDMNNDGNLDIVIGSEEGLLSGWDIDGNYIPGFPIYLNTFIRGTPMVKDLDYDMDIELVATCWDLNVYIWDFPYQYTCGCAPWNGFRGNINNTGWAEYVAFTGVEGLAFSYRVLQGILELKWSVIEDVPAWNLYRREVGREFELLRADLKPTSAGVIGYVDRTVEEGVTYMYKIEAGDRPALSMVTEGIEVPVVHGRLYQNHPNPFNPSTVIPFTVPGGSGARENVLLVVYDARGARVKTLVNEPLPGGRHEVIWDGSNMRGESAASGIYFARLAVRGVRQTRKLVLLR